MSDEHSDLRIQIDAATSWIKYLQDKIAKLEADNARLADKLVEEGRLHHESETRLRNEINNAYVQLDRAYRDNGSLYQTLRNASDEMRELGRTITWQHEEIARWKSRPGARRNNDD